MEERHIFAFTGFQMVATVGLLWFLITWTGPWNATRHLGTVLVVVGLSFIGVARCQLGRSFFPEG